MDPESSSNPLFDELWNQALDRYFVSMDRSPEEKAALKRIHNAEDLSSQLEAGHGKFGDWRNKHSKFFSALSKGVRPFVVTSEIAQSAVGLTPFAPASTILVLVKAADGVSEAYEWIEQLFDKLSGFTQRLEQYADGSMNIHLQHKVVAIFSCLLEILGRSEKVIKDGRFRRYAVVLFLGKDEKVKASFDNLAKLFDDEQRLVLAISYATSQRIETETDKIEMGTERVQEVSEEMDKKLDVVGLSLQEASSERRAGEQKALLEKYLDNPARRKSLALYSEYAEDALKSSGEWLLSETKFQDWMTQKLSLLWVAGGPGTGKSYLSAIAISKLNDTYPQDLVHPNRLSIGYFYIKEHDQDLQDLTNILKTIAYQISSVDAVFRGRVLSMLSKPETMATPRKIWENLFLGFYYSSRSASNTAIIVIDGLDEAPKKTIKELFHLLEDLKDPIQDRSRLSFALFGRPELTEHIEPKLEKIISVIEIGEKNLVDIGLFIKEHVKDILVIRQMLRSKTKVAAARLARQIRDKVMAKADGMFFKVVLIMNQLYDKERTESVFQAIDDAPPKLEAMISHVFERLLLNEDVNKVDLHEILTWVAFSKRPLFIAELYAILRLRTGQAYDALEARLRGRFASLFKLYYDEGDVIDDKLDGDDINGNVDFDIDLDSGEIDLDEDTSDAGHTVAQDQSNDKKSVQEDALNEETVKRFYSIEVRFTHASIRDFLVKDRSKSVVPLLESSIGIDSSTADMHLASICMRTILEFNFEKGDCDILQYASVFFLDHLLAVETSKIAMEEKQHIVRQLCGLFYDPVGVRKLITISQTAFNKALHQWFENPEFSTKIRKDWLNSATSLDQYSTEEWEWISKATVSREEFFRPLAIEASRMWLSKMGSDDQAYLEDQFQLYQVWIVHCYLNMDLSDSKEVKNLNLGGLTAQYPPSIDLEGFNRLARFSDPEETQHWHTCFAWVLVQAELYAEAMVHFDEALEIDKTLWKALQGRSKCLAQQEKYDEAAQTLGDALKLVPESMKNAKYAIADLKSNLTNVILAKGDYNAALRQAQEMYSLDRTNCDAIAIYIQALYALHDYEGIVKTVENLREIEATSTKWKAVDFIGLRLVQFEIGCALRIKGKLDLVRSWVNACSPLDKSLRAKPFGGAPWVAAHIAEFTYSFYSELDESMAICEYILSSEFKSALGPELAWAYEYPSLVASQLLSNIYFQKAVSARKAGKDTECWTSRLRDLAMSKEGSFSGDPVYKLTDASLLLGIFLRRYGGAHESIWKPCFRGQILQGIDMLGDGDTMNDAYAYGVLTQVLMTAGNKKAALEALAVVLKPLEAISDPGLLKSFEAVGFNTYFLGCDGPCHTQFHTYKDPPYKELYYCEDCMDVAFCEDCFPIAKRGELPYRKCSPDHTIVQIFPIREEARDVAAQFVDRKTMEVQKDWLDALRKEWL